jgi:hypothetical protein
MKLSEILQASSPMLAAVDEDDPVSGGREREHDALTRVRATSRWWHPVSAPGDDMEVAYMVSTQATQATGIDGTQQVWVIVRGGYYPCLIRARAGRPLRLVFDRQEDGECTSRVVFPDFGIAASLPAFTQTMVELTPGEPGAFGFSCGMEMIWGILLVENGEPTMAAAT